MGLLTWLRSRMRSGLVPFGGTISVPTDDDNFPIAIANELLGGLHGYRTFEELAGVPVQRLANPMLALVNEHIRPDGSVAPQMLFLFNPTDSDWNDLQSYERISDVTDYDLSVYWKSFIGAQDPNGDIQYQYAPEVDYGGVSGPGAPAFQPPLINAENYQLGYKSDADHTIIWEPTINELVHKYFRQRIGDAGKWGIPIKRLTERYTNGDYVDNQFIWVAKGTVPPTPKSLVNGQVNNNPAGWQGTPEIPGGIDYYVFIQTHDLFKISATKNSYQNLKSEWSQPIKMSTDPQLIRYGNKPSSTNFINEDGSDTADWRGYYTPGTDTHMAIRLTVDSTWRIENIDNESGEYVDFIFKAFPLGYEPTELDRPTIANPFSESNTDYPNNKWKDSPFKPADNEVLHRSVGRKYNNGDLKVSGWSIPTPSEGQDILQVIIAPKTATTFKYNSNGTVAPGSVQLVAEFYRGNNELISGVTVKWYKGTVAPENEIIAGSSAGVSQYHSISGDRGEILNILPNAVDNSQLYTVRVLFEGEDYVDTQAVLDVSDSDGYLAVIESNDGFVYKNQVGSKTFIGKLHNNGIEVDPLTITFAWFLGGANITPAVAPKNVVSVSGSAFTDKEVLKVNISVDGKTFTRTETLVDLEDAKATVIMWSTSIAQPAINDPSWTSNPANAIWMKISPDGGGTWNVVRVKGESAPYNGGFHRIVYKNSATKPVATGLTSDLFPSGGGWTAVETEPGAGEHIWRTSAFFTKVPFNSDGTPNTNVVLNSDNWAIAGTWGVVSRLNGIDGEGSSTPGPAGPVGWAPEVAAVSRGNDEVHQVVNWLNLGGADPSTKPATGYYIGASGYVTDISQAKNIRGQQGPAGVFNTADFWDGDSYFLEEYLDSAIYVAIRFRKTKAGIVHYQGSIYNSNRSNQWILTSALPEKFKYLELNPGAFEGVPLTYYHQNDTNDFFHGAGTVKIGYDLRIKAYTGTNDRVSVAGSYIAHDAAF